MSHLRRIGQLDELIIQAIRDNDIAALAEYRHELSILLQQEREEDMKAAMRHMARHFIPAEVTVISMN